MQEDPQVAAKCAPVRALLSKNFRASGQASAPFFRFGGLYDRSGAVLDSADANRIALVDAACRAWVHKEISGQLYSRIVLGGTSAAIVQTTSIGERDEITNTVAKAIQTLKEQGLLPDSLDPSKFPEKVAEDSRLTQQQLEQSLKRELVSLEGKIDQFRTHGVETQQAVIIAQLEDIKTALAKLSTPAPVVETPETTSSELSPSLQHDGAAKRDPVQNAKTSDRSTGLEVYFATASAELIYSERARIANAAATWTKDRVRINVYGSYDPRGSSDVNMKLAKERANAVVAALLSHGVAIGVVAGGKAEVSSSDYDKLRTVRMSPDASDSELAPTGHSSSVR